MSSRYLDRLMEVCPISRRYVDRHAISRIAPLVVMDVRHPLARRKMRRRRYIVEERSGVSIRVAAAAPLPEILCRAMTVPPGDIRDNITRLLTSPEVDMVSVATCIDAAGIDNTADVQALLKPVLTSRGVIDLRTLSARAAGATQPVVKYNRLQDLGFATEVLALRMENDQLRMRLEAVEMKLSDSRGAESQHVLDGLTFTVTLPVGVWVLPPHSGLPGGDLGAQLTDFLPHSNRSNDHPLATMRRCVRHLLKKLIPVEQQRNFTIRTRKGRATDTLKDFPASYRNKIMEAMIHCLHVRGNTAELEETKALIRGHVLRTIQEALNDMRRKSGARDQPRNRPELRTEERRTIEGDSPRSRSPRTSKDAEKDRSEDLFDNSDDEDLR